MKMNLSQAIANHGLLIPLLCFAILERSFCPLFIIPLIVQKRNQSLLSAQVTEVEIQMVNSDKNLQIFTYQMTKQTKVIHKQQHYIKTQQVNQKLMLSKVDKINNQNRQLDQ